jgi:hypothetical protein
MSEVKVNKISPRTACGTVTLGDSGDTFTIPSGATITNAGTASGFGATGETSWDTTVKTTGTFTATAGVGYFLNTTGGIITVNLPAGAAGSSVAMVDYAGTWQTNAVTVSPNGSEKMGGVNADVTLGTEGQSVTFVYIDGTQGWVNVLDSTSNVRANEFMEATGGTVTCSGDYKIHTFTGPGTFTVSKTAVCAANNKIDYLVVAGGGAGTGVAGSGAGAGGFRVSNDTCMPAPATSPLANPTGITASVASFPITVGAGGTSPAPNATPAPNGSDSIFSSITSAGGGGSVAASNAGTNGGSGSGGGGEKPGSVSTAGSGNTPPVSPAQGNDGGTGGQAPTNRGAGGGGGASAAGQAGAAPGGNGGAGSYVVGTAFAGCQGESGPVTGARYFAGGGGGGYEANSGSNGVGGVGGGGDAGPGPGTSPGNGQVGVINTGGGGGGGSRGAPGTNSGQTGGNGGSGIVILRYKYQ